MLLIHQLVQLAPEIVHEIDASRRRILFSSGVILERWDSRTLFVFDAEAEESILETSNVTLAILTALSYHVHYGN